MTARTRPRGGLILSTLGELQAIGAGVPHVLVDPKPKSPGLKMFMLMEVMLGKKTYQDRIPDWIRRLQTIGLDRLANKAMLRTLDRNLHNEMK